MIFVIVFFFLVEYEVYDDFDDSEDIEHLLCMVYARRYFVDSLNSNKGRAEYALGQMQLLYAIEPRCMDEDSSVEGIKETRQKEAIPIIHALGKWM